VKTSLWGFFALALACAPVPPQTAEAPAQDPGPLCPPSPGEAVCEEPKAPAASGVDAVKDEIVKRMNARDAKAIFEMFGPAMKQAVNQDKTELIVNGIANDNGKIVRATRTLGVGNERHAVYTVEFEKNTKLVLDLTVADDGKILGLRITEPPAPDPAVAKSTLPLALPFRGQWLVFWGGDTLAVNQHVTHKSQRRAADVLKVGADGKTHTGDGAKNSDYLAYGQEILAAADGKVETVIDGVPENEPGKLNPYFATGNTVILRHADSVFSVYAHLQPGKLRVKRGQAVKRGSVLGLCGNSGNSSEPHLHFQLQDGPKFEQSFGVEAVFDKVPVERDGKQEERSGYTFLKGDRVGK
jgi:murein DD-endopeptidase MepM/ murein hydrolase activator NlpD